MMNLKTRSHRALRAALCALLLQGGGAGAALPSPPLMEGARAVAMGQTMRINGMPTSIHQFVVNKPLDEVLAFYRTRFGKDRVEQTVLGWTVVAKPEGDYFFTVRLRRALQGTEGTVSVADLKEGLAAHGRPLGMVLPAGSTLISDVDMDDPGKKARVVSLTNNLPVETNIQHFKKVLEARGFRVDRDLPAGKGANGGRSLWLSANGREAILVVAPIPSGTSVVLNTIEPSNTEK